MRHRHSHLYESASLPRIVPWSKGPHMAVVSRHISTNMENNVSLSKPRFLPMLTAIKPISARVLSTEAMRKASTRDSPPHRPFRQHQPSLPIKEQAQTTASPTQAKEPNIFRLLTNPMIDKNTSTKPNITEEAQTQQKTQSQRNPQNNPQKQQEAQNQTQLKKRRRNKKTNHSETLKTTPKSNREH